MLLMAHLQQIEIENQDGATKVARNNAALRLGHQRLRVIGSFQKTNITANLVLPVPSAS